MSLQEKKYTIASAGPRIGSFLQTAIGDAGFDLSFEITPGQHSHPDLEDPDIVVKFSGQDVEMLRMPGEDHSLVRFDANDYRILRIEELRISAMTAAEKVKRTRAPFHFNPMNSRERRIIHLSLRNEEGIRSESTGTGPFRQVVVMPSDFPSLPEPILPPRSDGPRGRFEGSGGGRPPRRDGPPPRRRR
jgi:spoIIIJ-associated protein